MKRILNGMTFNTKTSTVLATLEREDENQETVAVLYQTRGGAFFVWEETTRQTWDERHQLHGEQVSGENYPVSPDQALEWMIREGVQVFHNPFENSPSEKAKSDAGATIYVRVPASLKKRVDDAARAANLSSNAWVMRCIEQCLDEGVRNIHQHA